MSVIHTNNITNKDGTSGPTISGITNVSSTGFMQVPVGDTFRRNVVENVVRDGLVLYLDAGNDISYPGSGTTWTDLSGENNNGTLLNGVGYNSDNGGSLVFDGVDDYGIVNNTSSFLSFASTSDLPFSISCFVKLNSVTSNSYIVCKYGPDISEYRLDLNSGKPTFFLYDQTNNGFIGRTYDQVISTGIWYQIVGTYSGGSDPNNIKVYLNGVRVDNSTITNNNYVQMSKRSSNLILSAMSNGSRLFNGNISQVSIYNRALSASEVLQNYNATKYRYEN